MAAPVFRIMPNIRHQEGPINEPVQRTFENVLDATVTNRDAIIYLYEAVDWLVTELDTEGAIAYADSQVSPGNDGALSGFDEFQSTNLTDITQPNNSQFEVVAGHPYFLQAFLTMEFTNQNDQCDFQWYNVTDAAYVGQAITFYGRQFAGNIPVPRLTAKLTANAVYEIRQLNANQNPFNISCFVDIEQLRPANPPPTRPLLPADVDGAATLLQLLLEKVQQRGLNFVGPFP